MLGSSSQITQHDKIAQYYVSYLRDAVGTFESAITRLKHCEGSQCEMSDCGLKDAIDMAHRIKGNAAMYDHAKLGLRAAKLELFLRENAQNADHTSSLLSIIEFIDDIRAVYADEMCTGLDHAALQERAPSERRFTLAVDNDDQVDSPSDVARTQFPPTADPMTATQPSIARKRIIIAYEDPWLCELLASLLEVDFDVLSCHTAETVGREVDANPPSLLVIEDGFDGVNAVEFSTSLKASLGLEAMKTFVAFASNAPDKIAEAISHGVNGFTDDKFEVLEIVDFAQNLITVTAQTVLVVDDDPVVRNILKRVLKSSGYVVETACDGLAALDYLSKNTPDIVLLDRFMPRLEGGTVLYEIQNKINLKSIPVLILTAMVNRGEAKSWFERGAADFIPKPFDPEEVLMRVKQHLETGQKRHEKNIR